MRQFAHIPERNVGSGHGDSGVGHRNRARIGAGIAAVVLHLLVIALLVRAFAPGLVRREAVAAIAAFTITPAQRPPTSPAPRPAGGGSKVAASRRPSTMPSVPSVTLPIQPVSPAGNDAATGGAGARGAGLGSGEGPGAGGGGQAPVKVSGEIVVADYPAQSRALRIGDYVIVALTVGPDGLVRACCVHRPSRDAAADAITCRLAQERFHFHPALDAAGHAVEAVFGWKQSWHY